MFTKKLFAGLAASALVGGGLLGLGSTALAAGNGVQESKAPVVASKFDTSDVRTPRTNECDGTQRQEHKRDHKVDGKPSGTQTKAKVKAKGECDGTHRQDRQRDRDRDHKATAKPSGTATKASKAKVKTSKAKGDCDGTQRHARAHHS